MADNHHSLLQLIDVLTDSFDFPQYFQKVLPRARELTLEEITLTLKTDQTMPAYQAVYKRRAVRRLEGKGLALQLLNQAENPII